MRWSLDLDETNESAFKGESEHKLSKSRYQWTSGKDVARALTKVERRQRTIRTIWNALSPSCAPSSARRARARRAKKLDPMLGPNLQYNIGQSENSPVDVPVFLSRNQGDPAVRVSTVTGICSVAARRYRTSITLGFPSQASLTSSPASSRNAGAGKDLALCQTSRSLPSLTALGGSPEPGALRRAH